MHCLLVPNLNHLPSHVSSIEPFNKQYACLFHSVICFSPMDFYLVFLRCFFFFFLNSPHSVLFLMKEIFNSSCVPKSDTAFPIICWLGDLKKERLGVTVLGVWWRFHRMAMFKCLNYASDSCVFFVNWNTILRRNLSLHIDQAGRGTLIGYWRFPWVFYCKCLYVYMSACVLKYIF